jgi:DNA-binding beta-propeller fold protein YncE
MDRVRPVGRVVLAALAAALACGGDSTNGTGPVVPADIVIVPNHPILPQGLTLQLTATVVDASGRAVPGRHATFSSADTTVARVTPLGLVRSMGPISTVRITAEDGGITNFVDLVVTQRIVGLGVTPNPLVINTNASTQLSVAIVDYQGNPVYFPGTLSFVSANPNVVTVSEYGWVQAFSLKATTAITVTADTFDVVVPVTVTQIPATIQVTPSGVVIPPGGSQQLTATVRDVLGQAIAGAPVNYISNSPALVSVSTTGLVTSIAGTGSGTITITSDTLQKTVGVFVGTGPTGTVVATTPVGGAAYAAAVASTGATVVSVLYTSTAVRGTLPGYTFPTTYDLGAEPLGVGISPDGTTAYVARRYAASIAVVDLTNNVVGSPIVGLGGEVFTVLVSPDGQYVFAAGGTAIYKVDAASRTILDSIQLSALHLAAHPTQPLLYASGFQGDAAEIDYVSMTQTRSFGPVTYPQAVAVAPDGSTLYFADEGGLGVRAYDLSTGTERSPIMTESGSFGLAVTADFLVVTETSVGLVEVFDRRSGVRINRIVVGGGPRRPAVNAAGDVIVVPNESGWVDFIR